MCDAGHTNILVTKDGTISTLIQAAAYDVREKACSC